MNNKRNRPIIAIVLCITTLFSTLLGVTAQAGIVATGAAVNEQTLQYDRDRLNQLLNSEGVREQLLDYGVQPDVVQERINAMNATELAQLNAEMDKLPAGEGVLGLAVLVFIVFIVTDMLCATDIFPFVNCINK